MRMRPRSLVHAIAASMAILFCVVFVGCEEPSSWAPRGEVEFLDLKEKADGQGGKTATLEYSIRNSGKSKISGSVFSFTFSTDAASYRCTVVDENSIFPGALVYGRISIAYASLGEVGALAGAVVDSVQFS